MPHVGLPRDVASAPCVRSIKHRTPQSSFTLVTSAITSPGSQGCLQLIRYGPAPKGYAPQRVGQQPACTGGAQIIQGRSPLAGNTTPYHKQHKNHIQTAGTHKQESETRKAYQLEIKRRRGRSVVIGQALVSLPLLPPVPLPLMQSAAGKQLAK